MVLTRLQRRRFFALFDPLTLYANSRLEVVDDNELRGRGPAGLDDQAQGRVARELWQNLNVIDDFVRENPFELTAGELDIVASWREGLSDLFVIDFFPDGELRFINGGYAFEVSGISKEIIEMVGELPAAVQTTLLPFDDTIVFAEYLALMSVAFSDSMLDLFERETDRIFHEGALVRTADDLIRVATSLRENELESDTKAMLADLEGGRFNATWNNTQDAHGNQNNRDWEAEEDEFGDLDSAVCKQHRGALADMPYDERAHAIDEHMEQLDPPSHQQLVDILDDERTGAPFTRKLTELLSHDALYDVTQFARVIGLKGARNLSGNDLFAAIATHLSDDGALRDAVNSLSEFRITALHELVKRNGLWKVREEDIVSLRDLPSHKTGLSYVFHEGDTFSFVMPDETPKVACMLNWDDLLAQARMYRELVTVVDKIADLRGIAPLQDVCDEYRRCCPNGYETSEEIRDRLLQAVAEERANFSLLQTATGDLYVLHYELFWQYEENTGRESDSYFTEPIVKGEFDEMLKGLVARQADKEPRPLTQEMLDARSMLDWRLDQGAARAFVQYLDAHVPDRCDDYFFADKVIEELAFEAMWGLGTDSANQLFEILEANDFVPGADQIQEILDLWSNLCNTQPVWPNNGWSPVELIEKDLGHPLFLNEDGSPRKVGRNDPCPCGSGLKYKKCCGR